MLDPKTLGLRVDGLGFRVRAYRAWGLGLIRFRALGGKAVQRTRDVLPYNARYTTSAKTTQRHINACVYINIYVRIGMRVSMCIHIHVHRCVYAYTHTHTYYVYI